MVRPSGALLAVCLLLAGEALAQSAKYKCSLDPGARNPGLRAVDLEVSAGAGREPWSVRGQFSLSANPVSDQHYYHGSLAITDTPPRSAREIVLKASSAIFMENPSNQTFRLDLASLKGSFEYAQWSYVKHLGRADTEFKATIRCLAS